MVTRYAYCTRFIWHSIHRRVKMVLLIDVLAPIRRQVICKHHDDLSRLVYIRGVPEHRTVVRVLCSSMPEVMWWDYTERPIASVEHVSNTWKDWTVWSYTQLVLLTDMDTIVRLYLVYTVLWKCMARHVLHNPRFVNGFNFTRNTCSSWFRRDYADIEC